MKYLMSLIMVCCVGCATAIPTTPTTTGHDEFYEGIKIPLNPARRGTCVKGEHFKADCNYCTCFKDGPKQDARCTKKLCRSDWAK